MKKAAWKAADGIPMRSSVRQSLRQHDLDQVQGVPSQPSPFLRAPPGDLLFMYHTMGWESNTILPDQRDLVRILVNRRGHAHSF